MPKNTFRGEGIKIQYYTAGEHYYPQIFFKQWGSLREMIEIGAKALGHDHVEFREIREGKNENK